MMKVIAGLPEGVKVENGAIIFDYSDADRIAGVFREYADTLNNGHKANGRRKGGFTGKKNGSYSCRKCGRKFESAQGLGGHRSTGYCKSAKAKK